MGLKKHFLLLIAINKTERVWELPFGAALSTAVPLLIGAYLGQMQYAMVVGLGALAFLYTTHTPIYHRMLVLMAASFGLISAFTLGAISHFNFGLVGLVLGMIATLGAAICRYYQLNAPGNFFFIMVATLGAYMPFELTKLPLYSGLVAIGCMYACLLALIYSLVTITKVPIKPVVAHEYKGFSEVVTDSVITGMLVGLSVIVATLLGLEKPYWVPISCLAVMQGMTLLGKWTRHLQRIIGTMIGLGLTWWLFSLDLNNYYIALVMLCLNFLIEYFVVRNYAIAAIFITPLTMYLAETSGVFAGSENSLIIARLVDIVLGSFMGVLGGICLHNITLRTIVERILKRILLRKPTQNPKE